MIIFPRAIFDSLSVALQCEPIVYILSLILLLVILSLIRKMR